MTSKQFTNNSREIDKPKSNEEGEKNTINQKIMTFQILKENNKKLEDTS